MFLMYDCIYAPVNYSSSRLDWMVSLYQTFKGRNVDEMVE